MPPEDHDVNEVLCRPSFVFLLTDLILVWTNKGFTYM